MTDYGDHRQPSRGPSLVQPAADAIRRSLTRNSHYSHNSSGINATTRSWVHSQQHTPAPPPSLPIPLPTPVQPLRPLPNPHAQHHRHHRPPVLYTVNPSEPLDSEEDQQRMDNILFGYQKAGPSKLRKPPASIDKSVHIIKDKKRTVLGGLVKSIRKIPKIIGYGAGKGATSNRRGTLGTEGGEGTSTSLTGLTTGSTLPQYTSNPPTPVVAPIPSRPHHYAHQPMGMQIPMTLPPLRSSPPPEVVRLDDVRRRRPDFRIMPPSINIARSETAHFFPGTTNNTDSSSSADNAAERTTVVLYDHDHHTPTPTPSISRQISSNGPTGRLSYVGSEQVVRPTSFHGGSQAPPPIEIPTSTTRMGTPVSYLSYVSQPTTVPAAAPPHVKRSSSQLRSQLSNQSQQHQQLLTSPPQHQPSSTPPIIEPSERIQSPISARPQPTTDYLKMALSPLHSLHHHTTALTNPTAASHHSSSGITSFSFEPSFSKPSGPIEKFFKTLYYMPWIAYERITVDYLPGKVGRVHGHALSRETSSKGVRDERKRRGGDGQRRETRGRQHTDISRRKHRKHRRRGDGDEKIASWYKGVSSRSKRTSAELDLLSSDSGLHSLPTTTTSIGATIGLGLENLPADAASPTPLVATVTAPVKERERRKRERKENMGDKQERTSHSRPHHHHRQDPHNRHRGRQRRRIGSPDVDEDKNLNQSPSPLIPVVYPFPYPPYPYPYPYALTMPSPSVPHAQSQSHPHPLSPPYPSETPNDHTQSRNQRGPRSRANNNHGHPSLSHPVSYSPGIPHPGYTAPAHAYQPIMAPSTSAMMAPQVYLLHSTSHGQLLQPSSSSGPVQNGSGAIGEGGGGREAPLDGVDSGQQ